jgi:hypothetical protein
VLKQKSQYLKMGRIKLKPTPEEPPFKNFIKKNQDMTFSSK